MGNSETIFSRLATRSALLDAWRVVQKKRSAGGIDRVSVEYYEKDFSKNIDALLDTLKDGTYVPEPYKRILISKEDKSGERRPLSLPTINDKIVQRALRQILEPVFNPVFLDISYAYRPGKGPAKAISRISHIISTKKIRWVVCADIDRFFDTMDHDILLAEFRKKVDEPRIIKLISMWMKIGVVDPRGAYRDTPFGVAQGGVISPLLSNVYLHPLDSYMRERGCHYVRYADNFILMNPGRSGIEEDFGAALFFLNEVLKLRLNNQKNCFRGVGRGFTFMGIFFKDAQRRIDRGRVHRMEKRLKNLVKANLPGRPQAFFKKLEERVRGFENYYGRLIDTRWIYGRLNLFLRQAVAEHLSRRYLREGRCPGKAGITALMAPVRLFGPDAPSLRDQWVTAVAEQVRERYEALRAESGVSPGPGNAGRKKTGEVKGRKDPEKEAVLAVRKQKSRYKKLETVSREVIIESPGVFVGKTRKNLVVKKRGVKILELPLRKLETINIVSKGITVSSDVIWHCSRQTVPLFFSDRFGAPTCVLQNPVAGNPTLGLLQLKTLHNGKAALQIAKEFVKGKIRNQINLLKYYRRHRSRDSIYGLAVAEEIPLMKQDIERLGSVSLDGDGYGTARNRLMGLEADAAKRYWRLVKILLVDDVPDFPGRRRRGARDLVNSLLNYGYGFLYRQVWRETVLSGLNPRISFLHAPRGEKPTLVYDLVEEFRPQAVDRVVFSMLTKNEKLRLNKKTGLIEERSKRKLIQGLLERQGTYLAFRGEKILLKNVIRRQVRDLCLHLKGKKTYRHFLGYY